MQRPVRTAAILTGALAYIALWVAFVTMGDEPARSMETGRWLPSPAISFTLIGVLFLTGLGLASRQEPGWSGSLQQPMSISTMIAALIVVGALLGLVASLRTVLWGGPVVLRWTIVSLAIVALVIGSGRAMAWAVVGGLIWSAVGIWSGGRRSPVGRIDLILTTLMVGTTIGAVLGTLWGKGRDRRSS